LRVFKIGAVVFLLACPAASARAGNYDGNWRADVPAEAACTSLARIILSVNANKVGGFVQNSPEDFLRLSGTVDESGNGTLNVGILSGNVKFANDKFIIDYASGCGTRQAVGTKDGSALSAAWDERKTSAEVYEDSRARARNGNAIPDSETAIGIAHVFFADLRLVNGDSAATEWHATLDGDVWDVWFGLLPIGTFIGGGAEVHFSKRDGHVIGTIMLGQ
jgi:hypothetical protein